MLTELQKRKLTKLFCMYDNNCGGFLEYQDFQNVLSKLARLRNWSSRSSKYLILENTLKARWKKLEQAADTSHNKQVNLEEWLNYYDEILSDGQKYNEQVRALVEVLFEAFDRDGDGKINQQEWSELLGVYNISPVYVSSIFPKIDINSDGVLTKEELLELIRDFYYSNDPENPANFMFGPY
ncbi:MAG: EF-hand domain-containing protein [Cyanobacteriota bacterium]|nr:EF-hand domain-containing protein [Cyanobacteriota bacterium]